MVLALPEDMLEDLAEAADARRLLAASSRIPGAAELRALRDALAEAKRPIMLLGGSQWDAQTVADDRDFRGGERAAGRCGFRRQDRFGNDHRGYAGDVGLGVNPSSARASGQPIC